jgi:integrase
MNQMPIADEQWKDGPLAPLPTIRRVPKSRRKKGWAGWVVRSQLGDKTFTREWEARNYWVDRVIREMALEGNDRPIEFVLAALLRRLEPARQENTLGTYSWAYPYILRFFEGRLMRSISVDDLVAFREDLAKHKSPHLLGRALFLLKQTFLHAKALEFVTLNPFDELPEAPPDQRARLTEANAQRKVLAPPGWVIEMMLRVPGPLGDFLNASILLGARVRETIAIDKSDYFEEDFSLHIWRQMTSSGVLKTKASERYVPVCDELAARLGTAVPGFAEGDGPLLGNGEGERWTYHGVTGAFYEWQVGVGLAERTPAGSVVSHYTIHQLRHAFVAVMSALGVDIVTIADWLGHSSVATTLNIYAHVLEVGPADLPADVISTPVVATHGLDKVPVAAAAAKWDTAMEIAA